MTIAEKIREKDDNVIIVFVTNMLQMAIKGYSVRAFDFVIKPISYNAFKLRFTDILKLIEKNQGKESVLHGLCLRLYDAAAARDRYHP